MKSLWYREIRTTLCLSILNRDMRSHLCEMHEYITTQEFRCTSGHKFSRATCDLCGGVVLFVQWLGSSFAACCYLGLMMWFIISKEFLGTEIRQQHYRAEDSLTVQESCRINLEAFWSSRFLYQSNFSLSFFFSHFIFLVYFEMSENCGNPRGKGKTGKAHISRER